MSQLILFCCVAMFTLFINAANPTKFNNQESKKNLFVTLTKNDRVSNKEKVFKKFFNKKKDSRLVLVITDANFFIQVQQPNASVKTIKITPLSMAENFFLNVKDLRTQVR